MADLLYIHSDAGEGSTEFVDLSGNDIALTANGNVKHSTAQRKFGATSIAFDGTGDYISAADHANWDVGVGESKTIDFWFRTNTTATTATKLAVSTGTWASSSGFTVGHYDEALSVRLNSTVYQFSGSVTTGAWHHIALVWDGAGSTFTAYLNGARIYTGAHETVTTATSLILGSSSPPDANRDFNGYIDELRIRNEAVWTANFTPPRTAYVSKDTYRDLVMANSPCNYWRLGEASGNAIDERGEHDLTWAGTPEYGATGALVNDTDTAMTLDGATEYASKVVSNYRSGDSQGSIEFWVNTSTLGRFAFASADTSSTLYFFSIQPGIDVTYPGPRLLQVSNDTTTVIQSTTDVCDGTWHHIVVTSNGSAYTFYVDGSSDVGLTFVAGSNNGDWFADTSSRDNIVLGELIRSSAANSKLSGTIDEVAVYDYPLSPQQIWRHYIEGTHLKEAGTRYEHRILMSKPVNYWRLDETAGPTATDLMGEHHLTWS